MRKATVNKAAVEKAAGKTAKKAVGKASPRKATAAKAVKATAKKAGKTSKKAIKAVAPPALRWVEAVDGACPPSHPVKAKLASRLFHLPGMAFYARTRADRCYADEESAVGDGLTRSKR